jgi:hypothetical protein
MKRLCAGGPNPRNGKQETNMLSVGITNSCTQRHPNTRACRSCYGEEKKGERYVGYKGSEMGNVAASGSIRLYVERKEEVYVKLKNRNQNSNQIPKSIPQGILWGSCNNRTLRLLIFTLLPNP